jgi:hypothetical protein
LIPRTTPPTSREHAELRPGHRIAQVDDLEAEARVRAVGPEAGHGLVVGQARPRRRGRLEAGGLEHPGHEPLDDRDDVLLLHEGHLEVELGELRLAVGAQILVAEAARDLVVALVAAHHQQLLEQLRGLRQRVEGARREPGGDEEVAGALGGGAGEDRRLDLDEVVRVQVVAHGADDGVAQEQRVAHRLAAQVEHPVAQADELVDLRGLVDRERRGQGVGEELHRRHGQLDLTRAQTRVDVALLAADHLPARREDVLRAQPLRERMRLGRRLRVEDELDDARAVAEVDEDEAAVVAPAVHPAGDADPLAYPAGVQLAAPGIAVRVGARRSHS